MAIFITSWIAVALAAVAMTTVRLHAGRTRSSGLFLWFVASLTLLGLATLLRSQTQDLRTATWLASFSPIALGVMNIALLLLLSALFMPAWWEAPAPRRRPPIHWIALPFFVVVSAVTLDILAGTRLISGEVEITASGYRLSRIRPGSTIALGLFGGSWLVHLLILVQAYRRDRRTRRAISILIGALLLSVMVGVVRSLVPSDVLITVIGPVQSLPLLLALGYAATRSRIFEPTRAAIDLALQAMSEVVVVVDQTGAVVYANPPAQRLGVAVGAVFADSLAMLGAAPELTTAVNAYLSRPDQPRFSQVATLGRPPRMLELALAPVLDPTAGLRGILVLGRDITEATEQRRQLGAERQRLEATVQALRTEQAERAQLAATVRALSLPLLPVLPGVLVLPLIGTFDAPRVTSFQQVLLEGITREQAHTVLLDVTGVEVLDAAGAQGLLRGVRAAALLGARCTLVGARPEIAQTLVALDLPLTQLATAATVQEAVQRKVQSGHQAAVVNGRRPESAEGPAARTNL